MLAQICHRYLARHARERGAHGLVALGGALDALLEIPGGVERFVGQPADEREHAHGDEDLQEGEAAAHCESPSPLGRPGAPIGRGPPSGTGEPSGVVGCRTGALACPARPTDSGRMTICCEAEMLRSFLPSFQLTVRRTSRTLFFKVSMKVFACP